MHGHVTDGRTNPWTTSGGNVNHLRSVMPPAPAGATYHRHGGKPV